MIFENINVGILGILEVWYSSLSETKVYKKNNKTPCPVVGWLDSLLYHESDLRIEEHYTDTAGFTDHVFGLMHLLGFRFAPRICDLADKRLYVPGKPADFPELAAQST
jgi:TnpA family transposase